MNITNDRLLEMRNTFALTLPVQRGRVTAPVEDAELVAALDELADLRAYKERTEAGLHKLSGMVDHCGDVTEDEMRVHGLWRDPPQAEVQP